MQVKHTRLLAILVLVSIVIYSILKNWVLRIYAQCLGWFASLIGFGNNSLFEMVKNQAKYEETREQTLGWLIYYPTYFLLHIAFIYLLFNGNRKVRNCLMVGLTGVIGLVVVFWIVFMAMGYSELGNFFRTQFRNLFGLPFILLAIEGGRILYKDMVKLTNQ